MKARFLNKYDSNEAYFATYIEKILKSSVLPGILKTCFSTKEQDSDVATM